MATGADATPPSDGAPPRGSINGSNQYQIPLGSFSESPTAQRAFSYSETALPDWPNGQNLYGQQFPLSEGPHAYAIETSNTNFASPDSTSSPPGMVKFEESPNHDVETLPVVQQYHIGADEQPIDRLGIQAAIEFSTATNLDSSAQSEVTNSGQVQQTTSRSFLNLQHC
jgi:hypothetical protein